MFAFSCLPFKSKKIRFYVYIGYSTIETKEADRIGYNEFLFPHEYSGEGRAQIHAEKETRYIRYTGKFFCFNNNVCNLYNNSVVEKIYGMAYCFTLLMFRKPNKTTINKNKTTNLYRSKFFRFSFIFRYFKVFQMKRIVYI